MNKTLAITAITLVAVVMGMSVLTPATADHGGENFFCPVLNIWDPNSSACIPPENCPNGISTDPVVHCALDTNINDNSKVVMCHQPTNSNGKQVTIEVSENAVDKHLAHGDTLGACS